MGLKKFPKRGEVYLVCLDQTVGAEINKTRPALIISNDIGNKFAETITIIPITSTIEKIFPFEVFLSTRETGLSKNSKAKCNQIRTIDKRRLLKPLGKISSEKMEEVEEALHIHLGMYFNA